MQLCYRVTIISTGGGPAGVSDPGRKEGRSNSDTALPELPGRPAHVSDAGLLAGEPRGTGGSAVVVSGGRIFTRVQQWTNKEIG